MVRRSWLALLGALFAGCQGQGSAPPAPPGRPSGDAGASRAVLDAADAASEAATGTAALPRPEETEAPEPGKAIAALGAVPAWQAVVDRARYLARRGQHGVVYGRLGDPIFVPGPAPEVPPDAGPGARAPDAGLVPSELSWLVDDTEGNGALAIRVKLGPRRASVTPGDRVALGGAWALDGERRWFWEVDAVTPLPPAAPAGELTEPPSSPGHVVVEGRPPAGARTISLAADNDVVVFVVVGKPPLVDGDGWQVADELGSPVVALLNLPGERASFGGLDVRAADERWRLARGRRYWVRIGKIRRPRPDRPAVINARTAPIRVD